MLYATKEDYREAWKAARHTDPPVPLNVDIELASTCNLTCPFCFISDEKFDDFIKAVGPDGKKLQRLMPTELAIRIIDECAEIGVPALKFNWRGESTLHPEYGKIVRHAWNKIHRFQIGGCALPTGDGRYAGEQTFREQPAFHDLLANTNANCKDQAIEGLSKMTKCMVSLDSLVPETYAKMRRGGRLERAKEVIQALIRREHPNLWVRRVVTADNESEPFFQMVRDTFGPEPKISQHFCFDRNASEHHQLWDPVQQKMLDAALFERTYCEYPSVRIVIASSGRAFPCCIDLQETLCVGEYPKQSLLEIWNGEAMRNLRDSLRANAFEELAPNAKCHKCESWVAYRAPQRAFVGDVEIKSAEHEQDQIHDVKAAARR